MNQDDLRQRLAYFEDKMEEALRRSKAKEPFSRKFSEGFTTEPIKDWRGAIEILGERLAGIRKQLEPK